MTFVRVGTVKGGRGGGAVTMPRVFVGMVRKKRDNSLWYEIGRWRGSTVKRYVQAETLC